MQNIILASGSPRRKQFLRQLIGDNFEIKTSSYEEDNEMDLKPFDLVLHHSKEKARDVSKSIESGIIIAADTLVFCDDKILGKPYTNVKAVEMLTDISGKTVEVLTGLTVIDKENQIELQESEVTKVKIKDLVDDEIDDYVNSGEPLDKAGAFAIQEKGAFLVERIDGCFSNVAGLPLFKLSKILEELGISIFESD